MVLTHTEEGFENKEPILTPEFRRTTELEARPVFVEQAECSPVHHRAKYFGANIHEHHSSPLVWVQEITALRNWDALTAMLLLVIGCAQEKIITVVVHVA